MGKTRNIELSVRNISPNSANTPYSYHVDFGVNWYEQGNSVIHTIGQLSGVAIDLAEPKLFVIKQIKQLKKKYPSVSFHYKYYARSCAHVILYTKKDQKLEQEELDTAIFKTQCEFNDEMAGREGLLVFFQEGAMPFLEQEIPDYEFSLREQSQENGYGEIETYG